MDSMPELNLNTAKATAKKATATLKSAGSLVAKKAERTKLASVTLPRAYAELGKTVYKEASRRREYPELFKAVDDLLAQRKQIQDASKSRPSGSGIAEMAKKAAADATDLAKTKALDLQAFQAFAKLGETTYQKYGNDSGPPDLVDPIAKAVAKRDELDREVVQINTESKGRWITPMRVVWAVGSLIAAAVIVGIIDELPHNTSAMRRVAEKTLPAEYGDFEMKWGADFLAGKKPSDAWGGTAELPNGKALFVSFFPRQGDFVWLSSPSDGGIYAAGYSDTKYWDSNGKRITNEEDFWKRAGYQIDDVMEKSKSMAGLNRSQEQQRKQRNLERLQKGFDEEYKKSKYR